MFRLPLTSGPPGRETGTDCQVLRNFEPTWELPLCKWCVGQTVKLNRRRQRGLSELSPEVGLSADSPWGIRLADSRTLLVSRRQQWQTCHDCQICAEPCPGGLSTKGRRRPAACIFAPVWQVPRSPAHSADLCLDPSCIPASGWLDSVVFLVSLGETGGLGRCYCIYGMQIIPP